MQDSYCTCVLSCSLTPWFFLFRLLRWGAEVVRLRIELMLQTIEIAVGEDCPL